MGDGFSVLGLTVLDVAVLGVILLSALLALMRGFVHEILAFSAWIGAAVATIYGFPFAQPYARELIDISLLADIAVGVTIFLVSLVVLTLFAKLLAELVQGSRLSAIDRILGLLFGMARGAAIVCLAWLIFAWLAPQSQWFGWIRTAHSLEYLQKGASWLQDLLPQSFLTSLGEPATRNVEREGMGTATTPETPPPATQPNIAPSEETQEPAYDQPSRQSLEERIKNLSGDGTVMPSDGGQ
ncbi:MAG: CvpA family protein [Rhodospirillales bacterium]|nr:CvpA family protein [Rhodospirillales bacterium]